MNKICLSVLFVLLSFNAFSQNVVTVKGKIIDETSKLPLESATIYLTTVKDSVMIDYTISDKNGNFSLKTKKIKQPVYLKISFIGYEDYKQELTSVEADKDFGVLNVKEDAKLLGEVVIKSEAPPVRIKKDTLEFNASSFKVRPDSNVQALLKQLPGVEVDANGKITVNGKEVNNILVNGKPFFGKDGKIATENLPSDIIDKVQITDTKTKEEELAGEAASSEEKTINLTIQANKNKGLFGKFNGGLGSDDRYESSGLINWFKDKQKFSFLGSSNNINSIGFSMDEIFDSMGGGRNVYTSSDGSFNIDGQQFGGGNGITQSNMIGMNYTDEFFKKMEPSGSYFYNSTETDNNVKSREERLQPTQNATGDERNFIESESTTRRVTNGHSLNFEFEYKIDSLTTLNISPRIKRSNSRNTSTSSQNTKNLLGELLNDSQGYNNSDNHNNQLESNIHFFRNFKKKGRSIRFNLSNENNDDESEQQTISQTNKYIDNETINRNQIQNTMNVRDKYEGTVTFTEPITDSLSVSIGGRYRTENRTYNRDIFEFNAADMDYSDFNDLQSNYISSRTTLMQPYSSIRMRKKKMYGGVNLGVRFFDFDNRRNYTGDNTFVNKNYVFPSIDGYFSYTIGKSKSVYMNYRYEVNMPDPNRLLDINVTNPLNTFIGNPDLKPQETHSFYLGYNNYDYPTKSGFYFYSGGGLNKNQVVSNTVYDASQGSVTSFENVDNTFYTYFGFDYSKSIKKEQHTLKASLGVNANINLAKGLTNNIGYQSHGYFLNPELQLSYEYGDLLTFTPSYQINFAKTDYTNYSIDEQTSTVHNLKFEMTSRWPKHFVFGNDFGYTYNTQIADGFRKDFYLWNMSLGYNFFKDKLLAKVKVYDLLNQNTSTRRNVTQTGIIDEQNLVLKRYAMFSLTYKIEKFGGKKKSEWD